MYQKKDDSELIKRQARFTGVAFELSTEEIKHYYDSEPELYKIRSKICACGKPVKWEELNKIHDEVLRNVQKGVEKLEQNES